MDQSQLTTRLLAALTLNNPPVALTFVDEAPADVPLTKEVVPSACAFWRHAETSTFYAPAEAHFNCPIGSMVMGFEMPEQVQEQLGQMVTMMCQCDYIDPVEPAHIPTHTGAHTGIVYGPLAEHPTTPSVVLLWLTPMQAMLCNEAGGTAKWSAETLPRMTGRPGCAALPLALVNGAPVTSYGCAGMRTFTEIGDDLLLLAIPGERLADFVQAAEASAAANKTMEDFYKGHKAAVAQSATG
ncbi:DUF169 domain-containing protein [Nonomuraea endophytica]|uniref:DUF169 domain-containing protein n=1 Tax=Nonomuraea endophytica TaxID=714136 RepID=UPI0037C561A5